MSHKHHDRCKCVDREAERCKALLCKLEEEYCRKRCALKEAIKETECRLKALEAELCALDKCYEKERRAIKKQCERRC
ncbi:hypothetical protein [Anaerosolibacter sp.]|uniref:hypothetical protein n=1 Tax=Anaerosolibacter sp. TaxID=1872527 RepID=UPI0039EEB5FD